jgi:hypothetical protein
VHSSLLRKQAKLYTQPGLSKRRRRLRLRPPRLSPHPLHATAFGDFWATLVCKSLQPGGRLDLQIEAKLKLVIWKLVC